MVLEWLLFIFGGMLAGFVAGLLGIGGGLIIVPFLVFILPNFAISDVWLMHCAVASSLAIVVVTSLASIAAHQKKQAILWPVFWRLLPGLFLGALTASLITDELPSNILKIIFSIFAFIMGLIMLFKTERSQQQQRQLPNKIRLITDGWFMAGVCNLLGLGGGSLMVPYLGHYSVEMKNAVATSSLCGLPIALFGVIGLSVVDLGRLPEIPHATGLVYWPAVIGMGIPSVLIAPWAAKLAHKLPSLRLRQIFAFFLLLAAIEMSGIV